MAIPVISYPKPAAPAGFEKVSVAVDPATVPPAPNEPPTPAEPPIPAAPAAAPSPMRVQYVNQFAIPQSGANKWTYSRPGAQNVQVWRNRLLQIPNTDYMLDEGTATITPMQIGSWDVKDVVLVNFLY